MPSHVYGIIALMDSVGVRFIRAPSQIEEGQPQWIAPTGVGLKNVTVGDIAGAY
ncbi:MAG: hypothetical protein K1X61_02840 [Chitinophagales bacterium]|nr:hypothetical protein [Chitinophagales bacterium]